MTIAEITTEQWILLLCLLTLVWGPLAWSIIKNARGSREEERHTETTRFLSQGDIEQQTAAVERGHCSTCGAPPWAEHVSTCGGKP